MTPNMIQDRASIYATLATQSAYPKVQPRPSRRMAGMFNLRLVACGVLALSQLAASPLWAASADVWPHRPMYGKGFPFDIADLPAGQLRTDLERLPADGRGKALGLLQQFNFPAADAAKTLRVDEEGAPYYVDPIADERPEGLVDYATQAETDSALQSVDPTQVFRLHSRPSASRKVYLNTQGFNITGTQWNSRTGRSTLYAVPFTLDSDNSTFTQAEFDAIAEIWKRVAEDMAPFDIDVTTERPSSFGPQVGHVLITRETDAYGYYLTSSSSCNCGGIAYVNVWGSSNYTAYQPALVFYERSGWSPHGISEAASHEFGHNLSLSHDGTSTTGYYSGNGTGYTSWAPIMGVGYYANVTQWSRGEYAGANNTQDDLALIAARLPYITDDRGNSVAAASALTVNSQGQVASTSPVSDPGNWNPANKGIINSRTDIDYFYVDVAAYGTINLSVTPAWIDAFDTEYYRGTNLDVKATLLDSAGTQIAQSDSASDTNAQVTASVAPGRYYLAVDGVGVGDPLAVGYTDYASVGQYFVNGSVPVAPPPPANPTGLTATTVSGSQINLAWADNASNETGYRVERSTDGLNFVEISALGQNATSYSANGLSASTWYWFRVRAYNSGGNSAYSNVVSVQTQAPIPVAPSSLTATATGKLAIRLNWLDSSSNEDRFDVQISTTGTSWRTLGSVSANKTTANVTGLKNRVRYYFRMQACNTNGCSAYSNIASAVALK